MIIAAVRRAKEERLWLEILSGGLWGRVWSEVLGRLEEELDIQTPSLRLHTPPDTPTPPRRPSILKAERRGVQPLKALNLVPNP